MVHMHTDVSLRAPASETKVRMHANVSLRTPASETKASVHTFVSPPAPPRAAGVGHNVQFLRRDVASLTSQNI